LDERSVIVVRGDESVIYAKALTLDGITATILGAGATIQPDIGENNVPVIKVTNSADVTVEGMKIIKAGGDGNADGVNCANSSTVHLSRVEVSTNSDIGIDTVGCELVVERSVLSANGHGGIQAVLPTELSITNTMIRDNGSISAGTFGGVNLLNTMDIPLQVFSFNTVTRNEAPSAGKAAGVVCDTPVAIAATGNIVHGNFGDAPPVAGNCAWEYSNIEGGAAGTGNIDDPPAFVNAGAGDIHLQAGSPGTDVTGLTSADIVVDIDGDARPQGAGVDMGADEVAQ
jgi:hypothetical protein